MIKEIITNPTNLPEIIVKWAEQSDKGYTGDNYEGISVTTLISPAYQRKLKHKYVGDVEVPIANKLWAMLGTAIHSILEKIEGEQYIKEQRLFMEFDGFQIHGQFDCYDKVTKTLYDFKVTSKYTTAGGKSKIEWEQQMNILAYLLREQDFEVENLSIIAIYRDHMFKDKYDQNLPKEPIQEIKLPVWKGEQTYEFIKERIAIHSAEDLKECTQEERWQEEDKIAVMEDGKKRALKLFPASAMLTPELHDYAANLSATGRKVFFQRRPGLPTRCDRYCTVNEYCSFYKKYLTASTEVE